MTEQHRGWVLPSDRAKYHYFDGTGANSLCWRWERDPLAPIPPVDVLTSGGVCVVCRRRFNRREARVKP